MPISINLGRINTCKIVGTKDRFIEVRCIDEAIPESWDCDPATGTCYDPGDGSGQWATEAACIAAPAYTNSCVDAGLPDSGVFGGGIDQYNWLVTNGHFAVNGANWYYESTNPPPTGTLCPGPNGGSLYRVTDYKIIDINGVQLFNSNVINDIVAYLAGIGITVLNTDSYQTINTAIGTSGGIAKGGSYQIQSSPCVCQGCGSGHGASWDCVQVSGTATCVDPGTGAGQYSTLVDCNTALAAGTTNTCDTNAVSGGTRVNAAAGTIFATETDAIEYYTNPANGISGTDASTLFFEIANIVGHQNPCQYLTSHTTCCEGPNSTPSNPTYMMYLPYMYIHYAFNSTPGCTCQSIAGQSASGSNICDCCNYATGMGPNNQPLSVLVGYCHPSWTTSADYNGVYGMSDLGVTQSWSWDELLTDAIAAGAPVTMNTPYMVSGNVLDPTAFTQIIWNWLDTNPAPYPDPDCHNCMTNNNCYQQCPNPNAWGGYTACNRPIICLSGYVCECEVVCRGESWDCDPATQTCYDPGTGLGPYTTQADCIAAGCTPPSESWDCANGVCFDPGTGTGAFTTLAACLATIGSSISTCPLPTDSNLINVNTFSGAMDSVPGAYDQNIGINGINQYVSTQANGYTNQPSGSFTFTFAAGGASSFDCINCLTPQYSNQQNPCPASANGCAQLYGQYWQITNHDPVVFPNGPQYDTWDLLLADLIAAGVTGVTATSTYDDVMGATGGQWNFGNCHGCGLLQQWSVAQGYCTQGQPANADCFGIGYQIGCCSCESNDCGSGSGSGQYECVMPHGCIQQNGGTYLTLNDCLAASTIATNTCDGTTVIPTPQANYAAAWEELTINYPTVDISTISAQIISGGDPCRPPLASHQTHCEGKEGWPLYQFGAYTFVDTQTGNPLAGLQASYVKWSDFLTDAQAIPIAGIGPTTGFADACLAIQTHYAASGGTADTCAMPLANNTISAPAVGPNTGPPTPAGCFSNCGACDNYHINVNGALQYITTQANGLTSAAPGSFNWLACDMTDCSNPNQPNCVADCVTCQIPGDICPPDPTHGCNYLYLKSWMILNSVFPNGPFYATWDLLLADLIAAGVTGVTATSTYDDVMGTTDGPQWCGQHGCGLLRQWAAQNNMCQLSGTSQTYPGCACVGADGVANCPYIVGVTNCCECATNVITPQCSVTSNCCVCEEGRCPEPPPPAREECLTLWLHAGRLDTITTDPAYPQVPPSPVPPTYYVKEWFNLAYDSVVGVYPYDPTAFYTYDTITPDFSTAPILDLTTFPGLPSIKFKEQNGVGIDIEKFLIANPNGPAVLPLQPDTNPNTNYAKGWSVFFRRCTTEKGWVNSKSWFMGDDWTQTPGSNIQHASGLKPAGQPYCRSVMFGHQHADETVPDSEYTASYINQYNPTGEDLYLPEGCYTHWIIAKETLPTGSAGNTFDILWGIGNMPLFRDTMSDIKRDLILENINTRNRDKANAQSGWYQEIRAYNCAFNKYEVAQEVKSIDDFWGPTLLPQPLPPPCGSGPGSITTFDGIDQTRVEVVEANNKNTTILPSSQGFTAAFWVRMDDCVDDDACFFEKGINLPTDNEQVAFRLYLTDDPTYTGKLYWDVFGDNPVDYVGNYQRAISNVAWLGESSCANLIGKWKHIAVTFDGNSGSNKKIYIDGEDVTTYSPGQAAPIYGNVRRDSNFPLVIGDSSRVDYTFKGDFSQFMTWNKALSAGEISDVYNSGETFSPNVSTPSTMAETLGQTGYQDEDRLTFYTNFDTDPITHETQYSYTINKYGGVVLNSATDDVDNALLPTDIEGIQCWFRSESDQLFDLDAAGNTISRATYMLDNLPQMKDQIRLWECHASTGRYCMPDPVNTAAEKMWYQQNAAGDIEVGGLYTDSTKQLQIFHTKADGGIQFPAANGTVGAFTIMVKVKLEQFVQEAIYGNTGDNMLRVDTSTQLRVKIGGAGASTFTIPTALQTTASYIITISRNASGDLTAYINGGPSGAVLDDQILTGTFNDADAFVIDYLGGVPGQAMKGWFYEFIAWDGVVLNAQQRMSMYNVINHNYKY